MEANLTKTRLLYSRFNRVLTSAFTLFSKSSFPQGWQKCDDPSCGYTTRQVPLTHQRGAPRCTSCLRAHLHPVVRATIKTLCYTIKHSCSSIFSEVSITRHSTIIRWFLNTALRKWRTGILEQDCLTTARIGLQKGQTKHETLVLKFCQLLGEILYQSCGIMWSLENVVLSR